MQCDLDVFAGTRGPAMMAPTGVEVKIGQRWREVDPRFTRIVEVIGLDEEKQKVQIQWVRKSWARLSRFNGKRGGYALFSAGKGLNDRQNF